jgi:hypothetical protein
MDSKLSLKGEKKERKMYFSLKFKKKVENKQNCDINKPLKLFYKYSHPIEQKIKIKTKETKIVLWLSQNVAMISVSTIIRSKCLDNQTRARCSAPSCDVVRKKWPFRFYLSFSTKWPCVCGQVTTSV